MIFIANTKAIPLNAKKLRNVIRKRIKPLLLGANVTSSLNCLAYLDERDRLLNKTVKVNNNRYNKKTMK